MKDDLIKAGGSTMTAYLFKITLLRAKPGIWRRIAVPAGISFKELHDAIQYSMGWQHKHLHKFTFKEDPMTFTDDEKWVDEYNFYLWNPKPREIAQSIVDNILNKPVELSSKVRIDEYLLKCKVNYTYDFEDNWQHEIQLNKIIEDYPYCYPSCLEAEGACPPEDVGGIEGYRNFSKAWRDPEHPKHEQILSWAEAKGYTGKFSINLMNENLKKFCS
jgi:hypothetical protein